MNSKSIALLLPLLLMSAVLLTLPGAGGAAMWIGIQGGPNFVANDDVYGITFTRLGPPDPRGTFKNVKTEPAVLGEVTVGYDFVKGGF